MLGAMIAVWLVLYRPTTPAVFESKAEFDQRSNARFLVDALRASDDQLDAKSLSAAVAFIKRCEAQNVETDFADGKTSKLESRDARILTTRKAAVASPQ